MNYQDYKDARDASWRILIDCEVTELPVRISGVCRVPRAGRVRAEVYAGRAGQQRQHVH